MKLPKDHVTELACSKKQNQTMKKLLALSFAIFFASVATAANEQIRFSWTDNSDNETGFRFVEVDEAGQVLEILAETAEDVATVTIPAASVEGKRVAVLAFNAFGESGLSNSLLLPNIPTTPEGLTWEVSLTLKISTE